MHDMGGKVDSGVRQLASVHSRGWPRNFPASAKFWRCVRCASAPDMRMAVVGSPQYFARYPKHKAPPDLTRHNCINIRLPTYGGSFAWEFEEKGQELKVRVEGQLVFNNVAMHLDAALQDWPTCPKTWCIRTSRRVD
jgi:hypothetical protein